MRLLSALVLGLRVSSFLFWLHPRAKELIEDENEERFDAETREGQATQESPFQHQHYNVWRDPPTAS